MVFSLAGWSPHLPTGFLVSRGTLDTAVRFRVSRTGLSPSLAGLPRPFCYPLVSLCGPKPRCARTPVWAPPRSLAATCGIDVSFFSSGYLDVSVRRVPSAYLSGCPSSVCSDGGFPRRVSPFRDLRIVGYVPLPAAFRSLSRLSSAPSAKASSLCSF